MGRRDCLAWSRRGHAVLWLAAAWLAACEPSGPPTGRPAPEHPRAESPAAESPAPQSPAADGPAAGVPGPGRPAAQSPAAQSPAAEISAAVDGASRGGGAAGFDADDVKPVAEYLREPRFAAADLERGELLSLSCQPCHTFGAGQPNLLGPNLHGVFGRTAAAKSDFVYTDALRRSGIVWTPLTLEAWLADPAGFVDGTSMGFGGFRSASDRRDLLAYLMIATTSADAEP